MIDPAKKARETSHIEHLINWLTLASSFILGISFGHNHQLLILGSFALLCTIANFSSIKTKQLMLCIALFAIGYGRLQTQRYYHHNVTQTIHNKTLNIQARIVAIEPAQHALYRYAILADVYQTTDAQNNQSHTSWRLQYYTKQKPNYSVGDMVAIEKVKVAKQPNNSFASYLIKEGIHATAFLHGNNIAILHRPYFSFAREINQFKHAILQQLHNKCSKTTLTLLSSIFLGNRTIIKQHYQRIKDLFCDWGIVHYLARSGIHLVIFILLLQAVLQWLPLPIMAKHSVIILATGLYALLTWPSISFARAFTTFLWYKGCHILGLQINIIYIILMLSSLFLFVNPSLLFFLDFQLSFALTFVLAIIHYQLMLHRLS